MTKIVKNRNRKKYTFANINLLGKCNCCCYFCLGKDIEKELQKQNQLNLHFSKWKNFQLFLNKCEQYRIKKIYITGQTADSLQYKYLSEIILYLQNRGFVVGIRTNGYLALEKMRSIEKLNGEVGYTIHSLSPIANYQITGKTTLPDWTNIIPLSGDNVRISIVFNYWNAIEINNLIKFASLFPNVKYIQIRRISTDTRIEQMQDDIDEYEKFYKNFAKSHRRIKPFCLAPQFLAYGKKITFWRTVETNINSLNYFTDGTVSDEYFIVEGYLKNKK